MKVHYNIEIQMAANSEITDEVMETASRAFGFLKTDVDELESYRVTALFTSDIKPSDMKERARKFLVMCSGRSYLKPAYYVDVMYRFEYENIPDRFVIWNDGRVQEYTGHIVFTEDGEDE